MKSRSTIVRTTVGLLALVAVALTGCADTSSGGRSASSGSVASQVDLTGVTLTVGSKEYTEQKVLGQLMLQSLKATGAQVKDQIGLNGTKVARAALTSGQIDAYYEYTGTGWLTILRQTQPINDPQQLFASVRDADAKNNVSWFALAPMNDTYAVGATAEAARGTGVTTLSQYAELARTSPERAKLCSSAEFATREDGLPGLEKAYGFTLPDSAVFQAERTVEFEAAKKGDCNFLRLDSTDSRILKNGVVTLVDDKKFFPVYNPAITMRSEVYAAHRAQYDRLFTAISALLTQDNIMKLNAEVELDGLPADKVALRFLKTNGII